MPEQITIPEAILEEIIEEDRVLVILPGDCDIPLGEAEFVAEDDPSEHVEVKVVRTSRARLKHVPVSDRVLNGTEDLMETLVRLRQWSETDINLDDVVTVVRFETAEEE